MADRSLRNPHDAVEIDLPGQLRLRDTFHLPFPSARHPATDAIEAEHHAWLRAHGLMTAETAPVFRRARFHDLAGRVYHRFDRDGLRLAADFIAALFVLDDLMDTDQRDLCRDPDAARRAADLLRRAARTGRPPAGPRTPVAAVAGALADLTRRLRRHGAALDGYLAELDVYLDGVVDETVRRRVDFPSVAAYADARVAFSAVCACVELGLALRGRRLTPPLRPLARAANVSVSWVNDVFSWPKERALGEPSNLVRVLMQHEHRSERDAFHTACRRCDEVATDFLRRRDAPDLDPEAVDLLAAWMRGNLDWHAVGTARYRDHLSVAPAVCGDREAA